MKKPTMISCTRRIDKSQLKECTFQKVAVQFSDYEIRERNRRLYLAMLMGNNFKSKVRIVFNTIDGYCEVFTTVWATTEKFIMLKGGMYIPMESIARVDIE